LLGMLAAIGSAAIQTAMCTGYNICQFFRIKWDKNLPPTEVPTFTVSWIGTLVLALVIALTGIQPLKLVDYSIILGMVLMPFTYYPILKASGDHARMGKHATGRVQQRVAWGFFVLIVVAAVLAIPLMVITKVGQP